MVAPAITARQTPNLAPIEEGHGAFIVFANDPDIALWEKGEVTPPGFDGGDEIPASTHHNTTFATKAPRTLIDVTNGTVVCGYNPASYAQIRAQINVVQSITWVFPDGDAMAVWAYLKSFQPGGIVTGEYPEATVEIVVTNRDPNTFTEEGPVYQAGTGTP